MHIPSGAWLRVVVVLVGHAVVMLEAELGKVRCDLDAGKPVADEVLVHPDQVFLRVPPGVVERPVSPGGECVEDLILVGGAKRGDADRLCRI